MIICTPSSDSTTRSSTVSTGSPPRSAIVSPSTTIASGPSMPSRFSQPGRPSATSRAIRARAAGSTSRSSVAAAPPSCAHAGSRLASSVQPAP